MGDSPDESYGTSYFGQVNSTTSSIFNFDIPSSYEGKTCSVVFLFPKKEDLETANYDYSGSGSMSCDKLEAAATEQTTYNIVPKGFQPPERPRARVRQQLRCGYRQLRGGPEGV